jgi:hypothetical protein
VNVDLAELDRLIVDSAPAIIPEGGFTKGDIMARCGLRPTAASGRIASLIASGKIEFAGYRPGPAREKVYKIVAPAAQG